MERIELEKLIGARDDLRLKLSRNNPQNSEIKSQIEAINQKIRALVAQMDAGVENV